MSRVLVALVRRDLALAARVGGSGGLGLVFFLLVVVLVPFAIGPDLNLLARIGPAILWIAGVLATLIGLDRLFGQDAEDGALDLFRLSPAPLEIVVLAKAIAHWLTTGLPLVVFAPLCGLLLAIDVVALPRLAVALLLGTPALAFVGAIGSALTCTIRRGGLVAALLVGPLMVPTLIFGVAASDPAGRAADRALTVLAALSLASGAVAAIGGAAALRAAE